MAKLSDQIKVKVADQGSSEGKRKFALEVEAGDDLFYLSDALMREGVVSDLSAELRSVVRTGVLVYVQKSRELVRKVNEKKKAG